MADFLGNGGLTEP